MPGVPRRIAVTVCLVLLLFAGTTSVHADEWGDARKAFRKAQRDDDWQKRRDSYMPMLMVDSGKAVDEVLRAMERETNPAVLLTGMETLAQFISDDAVAALLKALRASKGSQRLYLIIAMGQRQDSSGDDVLMELALGKDAMVAAQAALSLGKKRVRAAIPVFLKLLERDEWQLRAAAARALEDLAGPVPDDPVEGQKPKPWIPEWLTPETVLGPLALSLERSEGRERADIINALERISRQKYGNDVDAWKKLASGMPPAEITRGSPAYPPYILGIPIYGRKIVIIIDISTCTDDVHPFQDVDRLKEVCSVPGARSVPWYKLRTTKQFFAAHAKRLIQDLPSRGTKFEVIAIYQQAEPLFGKLNPSNSGNKQRAATFIDELTVQGGPNHYEALIAALDISGSKDSIAWSLGPDEIVLLTCAIPWAPRNPNAVVGQEMVGRIIGLKARLRMVPIHSIGVGPHPYGMMGLFSELAGGEYRDLSK